MFEAAQRGITEPTNFAQQRRQRSALRRRSRPPCESVPMNIRSERADPRQPFDETISPIAEELTAALTAAATYLAASHKLIEDSRFDTIRYALENAHAQIVRASAAAGQLWHLASLKDGDENVS
jgi:hypothetical protein